MIQNLRGAKAEAEAMAQLEVFTYKGRGELSSPLEPATKSLGRHQKSWYFGAAGITSTPLCLTQVAQHNTRGHLHH